MDNLEVPGHPAAAELPYPAHFRTTEITKDGAQILVRPIEPEDGPLLLESFHRLSKATIFFRFFADLRELPPEWIHDFVIIDYTRDVAMAAVKGPDFSKNIVGVCRIMCRDNPSRGELAVTVDDLWQGKGLGSVLMRRACDIAKEIGMKTVWGVVSTDNKKFLALARKIGFSTKLSPIPGIVEMEMCLAAYTSGGSRKL